MKIRDGKFIMISRETTIVLVLRRQDKVRISDCNCKFVPSKCLIEMVVTLVSKLVICGDYYQERKLLSIKCLF